MNLRRRLLMSLVISAGIISCLSACLGVGPPGEEGAEQEDNEAGVGEPSFISSEDRLSAEKQERSPGRSGGASTATRTRPRPETEATRRRERE